MSSVSNDVVNVSVNNEQTNKENKMPKNSTSNKENTMINKSTKNDAYTVPDKVLNAHISKMNDSINIAKTSNVTMFDIFSDAYNELKNDIKSYKTFRDRINLEQSTVNKMEKICASKAISDNADKLPISWGTLHAISTMKEKQVLEAIESKVFHSKTTKKEVVEYKRELKAEKDTSVDATVKPEKGTSNDAKVKKESDILEKTFFEQLSSSFTERNKIDENGHKEIQKALKIINKYYEITSNSNDKKEG